LNLEAQIMTVSRYVTRRTAIASTLGAALAATALGPRLFAQEITPSVPSDSGEKRERLLDGAIERASLALEIVQTDLAAVGAQIDSAAVDDLIGRASGFLDRATVGTSDESSIQYAVLSLMTSGAASTLIKAGIHSTPLPSQEGISSHVLAHAYGEVDRINAELGADPDADVAYLLATARDLYAAAYQHYGAGSFGQAIGVGEASVMLAYGSRMLVVNPDARESGEMDEGDFTWLGGWDQRGRRQGCRRGGRHQAFFTGADGNILDFLEPTNVPEPNFQD
jgi:TolA-binding protein